MAKIEKTPLSEDRDLRHLLNHHKQAQSALRLAQSNAREAEYDLICGLADARAYYALTLNRRAVQHMTAGANEAE